MAIWRRRWSKLSRLSAAELLDLVRAQGMLVWVQFLVWVLPRGRLVGPGAPAGGEVSGEEERARALALAISRAAEHGVLRPRCLVRAIALQRLLRRQGIGGGEVRVGVRWAGGSFAAHAWVVWGGRVLGDAEWNVARFTPVTTLEVVGR